MGVESLKGVTGGILWRPPHEQSLQAETKTCVSEINSEGSVGEGSICEESAGG